MYADRYRPQPLHRGSLGLSVGIVGGLLTAALLSPTVITHVTKDGGLRIIDVAPLPPPPPPVRPKVTPKVARPTPRVTAPDPVVTPPVTDSVPVAPPDPAPLPAPGTIEGTGATVIDPPTPAPPVLVGARPDPRINFQPSYPAEERRAGREGVVVLKVLIGIDGRVRQVERIAAPSDAFWRATEARALNAWRFKPATRDGVAYEVWRTMTVRFQLGTE